MDRITTASLVAAIVLVAGGFFAVPKYVVLQAHAAEDRAAIARLILADVRESIIDLELEKVRIDNRRGLSTAEKTEQKALLDRKLDILKRREECLERGEIKCP